MVKRKVIRAVSPPSTPLFNAPAPIQSRSRVYSHGHSRPIEYIRGRSGSSVSSRSKSSWTEDESEFETASQSSRTLSSANTDEQVNLQERYRQPSYRRLHLQRVFDLLQLSISRRDGTRAFRCLRILLKSHEWRPIELWRYALEVATLTSLDGDDESIEMGTQQRETAKKRLKFLREVSRVRTGLQLDIFIEIIPELLALGEEEEALAEIDIVLNQYPYRLEPMLHLYSALIFLKLSCPPSDDQEIDRAAAAFVPRNVSENDRTLAFVPHNLLYRRSQDDQIAKSILKEAERKFDNVLNVGQMQNKRGRLDVVRSRSRSRSRSKSESRSRSRSRSRSKSHSTAAQRRRKGQADRDAETETIRVKMEESSANEMREKEEQDQLANSEATKLNIEIGNDEWARNVARAYLEVLRAPISAPVRIQDSDEEMSD